MARVGKIARLPLELREEVNRRLLNGESGQQILSWLNAQEPVQAALTAHFNGEPIGDQNLTNWRQGEYQSWLGRRDRIQTTRELAGFAAKLAEANGTSIAEGGAAIAAGKILELLEATTGQLNPEELGDLVGSLANLRGAEIAQGKLKLEQQKLERKDQEIRLAEKKFRRQTCELFVEWADQARAREILASPGSNSDKIEALGQAMFGDLWKA
jgi:hypothetical protein